MTTATSRPGTPPAPSGTLLALHHPPVRSRVSILNDHVRLRNADELAAVVHGTDVIGILTGHAQHATWSTLGGNPCFSAPFGLIQLYGRTVVATAVPLVHA